MALPPCAGPIAGRLPRRAQRCPGRDKPRLEVCAARLLWRRRRRSNYVSLGGPARPRVSSPSLARAGSGQENRRVLPHHLRARAADAGSERLRRKSNGEDVYRPPARCATPNGPSKNYAPVSPTCRWGRECSATGSRCAGVPPRGGRPVKASTRLRPWSPHWVEGHTRRIHQLYGGERRRRAAPLVFAPR